MTTLYVIEIWDAKSRKYRPVWKGSNIDWANKMYDKPYARRYTRRVVRIDRDVLFHDKAGVGRT